MMTSQKEFLERYLCSLIPYKVKVLTDLDKEFDGGDIDEIRATFIKEDKRYFLTKHSLTPVTVEEIRPILKPLDSMTESDKDDFIDFCNLDPNIFHVGEYGIESIRSLSIIDFEITNSINLFFDSKLYDKFNLIKQGLAINQFKLDEFK